MNIHINRLVNNKLDNSEIRINIEYAEKNEDIKNLINHIQEYDKRKMVVFDGYNMIQINTEEIIYFYSDGNYNFCKTKEKEYRIKSKLYEIEKKSNDFLRISKSCIVNIKQVKSFDIGENRNIIVRFFDNSKQYVSRRKIKEVMNYLDERMM
ncbi:MAG: LytTR family DNA-binding domain-containing protein [Clostridia bacterium]